MGAGGEGGGPDLNMQGSKQRQMARQHRATLKSINDRELTEALARAPANQHVIWNGHESSMQDGSITARTLHLIDVTWEPIPLRILMQRAARIAGSTGLHPDAVRDAVRRHQGAGRACYFLVAKLASGDYVAVTDVPYPSSRPRSLRAGDVVLGRSGERFDGARGASLAALQT